MQFTRHNMLAALGITLLCFCLNGALFIYFYNQLATPFLAEEQRVANAEYIMSMTIAGYASVSVIVGIVAYLLLNARK